MSRLLRRLTHRLAPDMVVAGGICVLSLHIL